MTAHLQAALAFALTMMALATIVTMIMEITSRFLRRRSKNLRHMLALVYEASIKPQIEGVEYVVGKKVSQEANDFAMRIARSPFEPRCHSVLSRIASMFGADMADAISRDDFVRRFARDKVGEALHAHADDIVEAVDEISLRFDEVADAAQRYYVDSSRIVSILVGVALALVVNINGVRIYSAFINDPAKAERFIDNAEEYKKTFLEAQQRLDEARSASRDADGATPSQQELKKSADEINASIEKAEQHLSDLTSQGIDIGWHFAPHCQLRNDNKCVGHKMDLGGGIVWFIVASITGILIGFGGPFWYNVVTGLARATQTLRGRPPEIDTTVAQTVDTPTRAPDIFKAHSKSKARAD